MINKTKTEDVMLRKTFEHEIQQVKDDVLLLGSMVEQAILSTVDALKKRDIKAYRRRHVPWQNSPRGRKPPSAAAATPSVSS